MRMRSLTATALVLGFGLALTAGAGSAHADAKAGQAAPDFTLPTPSGGKVHLAALKGKVVLVDFWGSWCGPCGKELPALAAMYSKVESEGAVIVAVNIDTDRGAVDQFLKDHHLPFIVGLDPSGDVAGAYNPPAMPSSYLVGKDGVVRVVNVGYHDGDDARIAAEIKAAAGR